MPVRPGGHEFVASDEATHGSDGRRYRLCAVCSRTRRAAPHQPVDPRSLRHAPVTTALPQVRLPLAAPEPPEVTMFRVAADALLGRPDIGWTLRQRVTAARQALALPVDAQPAPVRPVGAPAERTTRPSRRGDARWVRKAIGGAMWDIAEAAIDQGFRAERTGNGHVRFSRNGQAFSLSTTVRDSAAHSLGNARASARRAGVKC